MFPSKFRPVQFPAARPPSLEKLDPSDAAAGVALAEAILGAVMVALVILLVTPPFLRQMGLTRRTASQEAVEAAVSRDLSWLSNYAKIWRMSSGPYTATAAQVGLAADPTRSSIARYSPPTSGTPPVCPNNLISQFLTQAASANALTLVPARPYDIPTTTGTAQPITITDPAAATVVLNRTITFADASTANPEDLNSFLVQYSVTNPPGLAFNRTTRIIVEAAAWCPAT